ncbi:hypothetical protein ACFMPD_16045 [Sedimentitalea sp. HM32M-2]|uniref:hypothetical protein n=1 Tax=Sedimentitalea sp. HM32M-2 TaxID=3351566 RepID=UPI00362975FA
MLLLAALGLIVVGFIFPPAWLLVIGGLIYFVASHKSRRDKAVESRVKRMVSKGLDQALSSDLFFEAARSYAVSKGARAPEKDAASTHMLVDGEMYFVVFARAAQGGTMISVRPKDEGRTEVMGHVTPKKPQRRQARQDGSAPRETAAGDAGVQSFEVGSVAFEGDPHSEETMRKIGFKIIREVDHRLKMDEQSYRYVMEEAEWVADRNEFCQELLEETGLLAIEYSGAREWGKDLSDERVALRYMEDEVWPDLRAHMGETRAECIRAVIFGGILECNRIGVEAMRGQHAVAARRILTQDGDLEAAEKWQQVIETVLERRALTS